MAYTPVAKVRNDLLGADSPILSLDAKSSASNHRPSLFAASAKTSLVTLVENNPNLSAQRASKLDGEEMTYPSHHNRENTWVDHFLGVFCIKRTEPSTKKKTVTARTSEWFQHSNTFSERPSPWILPVYVLSNSVDEHKHTETKIAKCTIDTGNLQGNIVSRDFVETLGYPESSFCKLTREEQRGATGITGDEHIPLGAVYLTWYHQNSTRVFRDMRFLVSPIAHFDLIIGAQSIQKDNILNVPCLMVDPKNISFVPQLHQVEAEKQLRDLIKAARDEHVNKADDLRAFKQSNPQADSTTYTHAKDERQDVKNFYTLLNSIFKLHKANEEKGSKLSDSEKKLETEALNSLKVLANKYKHGKVDQELRAGLKDPMWNNFWTILEDSE